MSEQKHMPGPWSVGVRNVRQQHGAELVPVTMIDVCATDADFETDQLSGAPVVCRMLANGAAAAEGVMEANARLIAAAPDLLAALRRLAAVAVWDEDTDRAEFDAASADAEAAIAKAEGRA